MMMDSITKGLWEFPNGNRELDHYTFNLTCTMRINERTALLGSSVVLVPYRHDSPLSLRKLGLTRWHEQAGTR